MAVRERGPVEVRERESVAARAGVAPRGLAGAQERATGLVAGAAVEGPEAAGLVEAPEPAGLVAQPVVAEPVVGPVAGAPASSMPVSYPGPAAFPQFDGTTASRLGRG